MRERAELPVITSAYVIWVVRTKFCFVFFRLVKLFDSIMCHKTIISSSACFSFFNLWAKIARIEMSRSFSVFGVVVELTVLVIMLACDFTGQVFEIIEIKMLNDIGAIWTKWRCLNTRMSYIRLVALVQLWSSFPNRKKKQSKNKYHLFFQIIFGFFF